MTILLQQVKYSFFIINKSVSAQQSVPKILTSNFFVALKDYSEEVDYHKVSLHEPDGVLISEADFNKFLKQFIGSACLNIVVNLNSNESSVVYPIITSNVNIDLFTKHKLLKFI